MSASAECKGAKAHGPARRDAPRTSLADECYARLKRLIVSCEIAPGERFTGKDLVNRSGFGRTPVREALARLDFEGLVETIPRSGYRATDVTAGTVDNLFDVWRLIGPLIARRAAERMTEPDLKVLSTILKSGSGEAETVSEILLAEATGSKELIFLSRRLLSEQERLFTLYLSTTEGRKWTAIVDFNVDEFRDPDVAAARITLGVAAAYAGIARLVATRRAG